MAVPKRFRFKRRKRAYKSIDNNPIYVRSLTNKKTLTSLFVFL